LIDGSLTAAAGRGYRTHDLFLTDRVLAGNSDGSALN
jgi:hypothetical protein